MIDASIVAERPDSRWPEGFLAAFLIAMAEVLTPNRAGDWDGCVAAQLERARSDYRDRRIGPRDFAPVVLLLRHARFVTESNLEPRVKLHVLITLCRAVEGELLRKEDGLTDRACAAALQGTLYTPLMPVFRQTIDHCFTAYKEPREKLVAESSSPEAWERAIHAVYPYLYLPRVVPIYDVHHADRVYTDLGATFDDTPATYTNEKRTPRPFYARLFSAEEMDVHESEHKMIDETYAHLHATISGIMYFGASYLPLQRAEILAVAEREGRLAALQRVLSLKTHSLAIPTYFADRLLDELTNRSTPDDGEN
jgi:hypothetical protein